MERLVKVSLDDLTELVRDSLILNYLLYGYDDIQDRIYHAGISDDEVDDWLDNYIRG